MEYLYFMFVLCIGPSVQQYVPGTSVSLSIYYSSLSYSSVQFITTQLYPTYMKLYKYMRLDFVPYGFTSMNNTENDTDSIFYPSKDVDCYGNQVQGCVLQQNISDYYKMQFIYCYMNSISIYNFSSCAEKAKLNTDEIEKCINENNLTIMEHYRQRTKSEVPNLTYLPGLQLNHKYTVVYDMTARRNLFLLTCQFLKNPPECYSNFRRKRKEDDEDQTEKDSSGDVEAINDTDNDDIDKDSDISEKDNDKTDMNKDEIDNNNKNDTNDDKTDTDNNETDKDSDISDKDNDKTDMIIDETDDKTGTDNNETDKNSNISDKDNDKTDEDNDNTETENDETDIDDETNEDNKKINYKIGKKNYKINNNDDKTDTDNNETDTDNDETDTDIGGIDMDSDVIETESNGKKNVKDIFDILETICIDVFKKCFKVGFTKRDKNKKKPVAIRRLASNDPEHKAITEADDNDNYKDNKEEDEDEEEEDDVEDQEEEDDEEENYDKYTEDATIQKENVSSNANEDYKIDENENQTETDVTVDDKEENETKEVTTTTEEVVTEARNLSINEDNQIKDNTETHKIHDYEDSKTEENLKNNGKDKLTGQFNFDDEPEIKEIVTETTEEAKNSNINEDNQIEDNTEAHKTNDSEASKAEENLKNNDKEKLAERLNFYEEPENEDKTNIINGINYYKNDMFKIQEGITTDEMKEVETATNYEYKDDLDEDPVKRLGLDQSKDLETEEEAINDGDLPETEEIVDFSNEKHETVEYFPEDLTKDDKRLHLIDMLKNFDKTETHEIEAAVNENVDGITDDNDKFDTDKTEDDQDETEEKVITEVKKEAGLTDNSENEYEGDDDPGIRRRRDVYQFEDHEKEEEVIYKAQNEEEIPVGNVNKDDLSNNQVRQIDSSQDPVRQIDLVQDPVRQIDRSEDHETMKKVIKQETQEVGISDNNGNVPDLTNLPARRTGSYQPENQKTQVEAKKEEGTPTNNANADYIFDDYYYMYDNRQIDYLKTEKPKTVEDMIKNARKEAGTAVNNENGDDLTNFSDRLKSLELLDRQKAAEFLTEATKEEVSLANNENEAGLTNSPVQQITDKPKAHGSAEEIMKEAIKEEWFETIKEKVIKINNENKGDLTNFETAGLDPLENDDKNENVLTETRKEQRSADNNENKDDRSNHELTRIGLEEPEDDETEEEDLTEESDEEDNVANDENEEYLIEEEDIPETVNEELIASNREDKDDLSNIPVRGINFDQPQDHEIVEESIAEVTKEEGIADYANEDAINDSAKIETDKNDNFKNYELETETSMANNNENKDDILYMHRFLN